VSRKWGGEARRELCNPSAILPARAALRPGSATRYGNDNDPSSLKTLPRQTLPGHFLHGDEEKLGRRLCEPSRRAAAITVCLRARAGYL